VVACGKKLDALRAMQREHFPKGSISEKARALAADIDKLDNKLTSYFNTPEANKIKEEMKSLRKKIRLYRESPEAKAAKALADKRKEALKTLELRLVTEAERFCSMRNEVLRSMSQATRNIASRCSNLPQSVRDVFRKNPPSYAEDVEMMSSQIAFKTK